MVKSYTFTIECPDGKGIPVFVKEGIAASPSFDPSDPRGDDVAISYVRRGEGLRMKVECKPGIESRYVYELAAQSAGHAYRAKSGKDEICIGGVTYELEVALGAKKNETHDGRHGSALQDERSKKVRLYVPRRVWEPMSGKIEREVRAAVSASGPDSRRVALPDSLARTIRASAKEEIEFLVRSIEIGYLREVISKFEIIDACLEVFGPGHKLKRLISMEGPDAWACCCSALRSIELNERLGRLSLTSILFTIVHEFCHIENRGHGKGFYDQFMRNYPLVARLVNDRGAGVEEAWKRAALLV